MKRLRLKLVLLAIGVFLAGLIVKFPASVAADLVARMYPGIEIANAQGSIWEGRFANVTVTGRTLDSVRWNLHALDILLLRITADTDIELSGDRLQATVSTRSGSAIRITDLRGTLDLERLEELRLLPGRVARGELLLDINSLTLRGNVPVEASGRVQLSDLHAPLLSGVALGNFIGELATTDAGIELSFRDTPGQDEAPLELQGSATLATDGRYQVSGRVRPAAGASETLRNGMQFLGRPDESGRYPLSFEGRL